MGWMKLCVCGAVASCLCGNASVPVRAHTSGITSREVTLSEIAAAIHARLDLLSRLDVEYTFDTDAAVSKVVAHAIVRASVENKKLYLDERYGFAGMEPQDFLHVETAFNGKTTTRIVHRAKSATVVLGDFWYSRTQGQGFFDLNAMNADDPEVPGAGDQSLIGVVDSMGTTVRQDPELVDGISCVVIDYHAPHTGKLKYSAWLDPDRGYLPLKQVYSYGPAIEFHAKNSHQIFPGFWVATKGTKSVTIDGKPVVFTLEVKGWDTQDPKVVANGNEPPDPFSVTIPDGYLVAKE